jgi:GNAT superfamily N-acetyltransferase
MKPMLLIPPCGPRWSALADFYAALPPARLDDLCKRFETGLDGGRDAMAIVPDGGQVLAAARLSRATDVGVLADLLTRETHRGRGLSTALVETLLSWFEMTGGRRVYLTADADRAAHFEGAGFRVLRRIGDESAGRVMLCRFGEHRRGDPFAPARGAPLTVRPATRADWPMIVELLGHRPGPDPRVPLEETAVIAEDLGLDLLAQQDRGVCRLLAGLRGGHIVALASVAMDRTGERTHAMILPHDEPFPALRRGDRARPLSWLSARGVSA